MKTYVSHLCYRQACKYFFQKFVENKLTLRKPHISSNIG